MVNSDGHYLIFWDGGDGYFSAPYLEGAVPGRDGKSCETDPSPRLQPAYRHGLAVGAGEELHAVGADGGEDLPGAMGEMRRLGSPSVPACMTLSGMDGEGGIREAVPGYRIEFGPFTDGFERAAT